MVFTMHGQDLFYIHYFPMLFVEKGIWDPYAFIRANFSYFPYTYYGPVLFIVISAIDFVFIKLFHAASLVKMLEMSSVMMFKGLTTVDYVNAFSQMGLFKNLFLMKSPYLIFDFLAGAILLILAVSKKSALNSYKIWMLNIVALHSVYGVGQVDLIPAFFIIAALFAAVKKRPYLCVVALSMGGATKLFPYILIIPACLLLSNGWKKRFLLLFTGGAAAIITYLPFYLSSRVSAFDFFILSSVKGYSGIIKYVLLGIFAASYAAISINAIKESRQPGPEEKLIFYFLAVSFLTYAVTPIAFRYFVFLTPLLALVIPQHKKFGIFTLLIILMLAFSRLDLREVQLGLFAPINPDYFTRFPTIQEVIGRFINIDMIYKVLSRVLLLSFFAAAWWAWRLKSIRGGYIGG